MNTLLSATFGGGITSEFIGWADNIVMSRELKALKHKTTQSIIMSIIITTLCMYLYKQD